MRATVFWVTGELPGRLGIVTRPRGGEWLNDEILAMRHARIDVVVSLLERDEELQLELQREAAAAEANGIDFRRLPIPDFGVPISRDRLSQAASEIVAVLETGKNVAVHCRQGIGRSSLFVASVLLMTGEDLPTVLQRIEQARGVRVPETERQRQWLMAFAEWLSDRTFL